MEGPAAEVARHVAPGGWRRIVTGLVVGVAAGLLARTAMPQRRSATSGAPSATHRDGPRG